MFYQEQIIDGVLCWRDTPEGEWHPYTPAQLSEMVRGARYQRDALHAAILSCIDHFNGREYEMEVLKFIKRAIGQED